MINEQERQEIIDAAVEKALLMLPEVVSHLFQQKMVEKKVVEKFYKDNPILETHKDIVAKVIEDTDGKNPGIGMEKVLNLSLPEIKKRIAMISTLDTNRIGKPTDLIFKGSIPEIVKQPSDQHGILE